MLHFHLNSFFLIAADNMLVQKLKIVGFWNQFH